MCDSCVVVGCVYEGWGKVGRKRGEEAGFKCGNADAASTRLRNAIRAQIRLIFAWRCFFPPLQLILGTRSQERRGPVEHALLGGMPHFEQHVPFSNMS